MAEQTIPEVMHVNIVTPKGPAAMIRDDEGRFIPGVIKAKEIVAPGELGDFDVLPGHIPFLTSLHPGVLELKGEKESYVLAVGRGFLQVSAEGTVEVMVERAFVPASQPDGTNETLSKQQTEAEEALSLFEGMTGTGEWQNLKDQLDWVQACIASFIKPS